MDKGALFADVVLIMMASDIPTLGTNNATQVAKHVAQRPDRKSLFFSVLLQFTSCGGDLISSRLDSFLDNFVR